MSIDDMIIETPNWVIWLLSIFVMAIVYAGFIWFTAIQCDAKWSDFQHRWGLISGCQVYDASDPNNGKWVPDERFRVIE